MLQLQNVCKFASLVSKDGSGDLSCPGVCDAAIFEWQALQIPDIKLFVVDWINTFNSHEVLPLVK